MIQRKLSPYLVLLVVTLTGSIACENRQPQKVNHLIHEKSPYLLQHVNNPVDWYPWGKEALEKAKSENKLLIVSIGYASCHWCHVMEKESFSDPEVSALMNEHFVSIKVDREERPDIDKLYLTACNLTTNNGCGWPLNAIALPDGKPVYITTYNPKKEWMRLLEFIIKMKKEEPEKLIDYADQLTKGIQDDELTRINQEKQSFDLDVIEKVKEKYLTLYDDEYGGIAGAPKFPLPNNLEFLLTYGQMMHDLDCMDITQTTLNRMSTGGLFDQLAGGFARYTVDKAWKVPHFEKMLYDNAQLVSLYAKAYKATGNESYKRIALMSTQFLLEEMHSEQGAFFSSIDADSEGSEGTYYVWSKEEIDSILQDSLERLIFTMRYDIQASGNWEDGKNILYASKESGEIAQTLSQNVSEVMRGLDMAHDKVLTARNSRVKPNIDHKILTSWNALAIVALADVYSITLDSTYLNSAISLAGFIEKNMRTPAGGLFRNYNDGEAAINGFLEDYAHVISANIQLYQVTFDEKYLEVASALTAYVDLHFLDDDGFYRFTSKKDPPLVAEQKEILDNVIPASNSVMARNLFYLGTILYKPEWQERSKSMVAKVMHQAVDDSHPNYYSNWLILALQMSLPFYEVAIIGDECLDFNAEMQQSYFPNALFLGGEDEGSLSLLKDKLQEGQTFIYVCQNRICKLPVDNPEAAMNLMKIVSQ